MWSSAGTFKQCVAEKTSFVVLNQVDLVLTLFAISLGLTELNPLMRYLVAVPLLLVVVKCAVPLMIAWFIPGKLLLPAIILLALIVGWNVKEMLLFFMWG